MNRFTDLLSRTLFLGSFVLAGIALVEKVVNFFGYTFLVSAYAVSRLLEFSAVALLFVFALLLRDISHELRARPGK